MQTWPLVANVAMTRRSIASGPRSASSRKMRRVVAAELHDGRGERSAGQRADRPAVVLPPVKATLRTSGCADQRGAGLGVAVDDREQVVGQRRREQLEEPVDGQRRERRGLHHDGVAGDERRRDLEHRQDDRRVPRRDRGDHAERAVPDAAGGRRRRRSRWSASTSAARSAYPAQDVPAKPISPRQSASGLPVSRASSTASSSCSRRARRRPAPQRSAARVGDRRSRPSAAARRRRRGPRRRRRSAAVDRAPPDDLVGRGPGSPARSELRGHPAPTIVDGRAAAQRVDHRGAAAGARAPRPGRRPARAARPGAPRALGSVAQLLLVAVGDRLDERQRDLAARLAGLVEGGQRRRCPRPRRPGRRRRPRRGCRSSCPCRRAGC